MKIEPIKSLLEDVNSVVALYCDPADPDLTEEERDRAYRLNEWRQRLCTLIVDLNDFETKESQ